MASKTARRVLGRGLTNLIPQDTELEGSGNQVVEVDVASISPNPYQPRKTFDEAEISSLADSIKAQGLLQPLLLRKKTSGYQIIAGERRYRALQRIGRTTVPAIVKSEVSDRDMLEMALVENVQRHDLNEIDKASAYEQLLQECGLSHEELSIRVGLSRSAITNSLRLLKLPAEIQQLVRDGQIYAGHARVLVGIGDPEQQLAFAKRIVAEQLSVREIEKAGQNTKESKAPRKAPPSSDLSGSPKYTDDPDIRHVVEQIRYRFGTQVEVTQDAKGGGSVRLAYFTKDDLYRILELLKPSGG